MRNRIIILGLICCQLGALPWAFGEAMPSSQGPDAFEIRSITVNEKPISLHRKEVNLGSSPQNIAFSFGPTTNSTTRPVRLRYKLDGIDARWCDGAGDMTLTVRFFNAAGDQVGQKIFGVHGESAGWNDSLETSSLTHRRETVVVPAQASRLWVVISSAGPPESVGVYVVANLVVSKHSDAAPPVVLMESPFDRQFNEETNQTPAGWLRDGTHPSMAKIVMLGQDPAQKAFAILDDDGGSHAEWHNIMESAPAVSPGDQIVVEWNEMFSVGVGNVTTAWYPRLPQGNYQFHVAQCGILGKPTGEGVSLSLLVPPPFWRTSWFWSITATSLLALVLGANRYAAWHKLQREMLRLKSQQALDQERLRIAQDIHDDLGARITEISLASALAQKKSPLPQTASADFERISRMSRELVSALYETVWAVNPENDNLEALGSYLCQMVNHICEQAQLPCRLQVSDLPADVEVSSQTRHNVIMAVKEAIHNVIKHAKASEVQLHVSFETGLLAIRIQDNGCGFEAASRPAGHGLINMKRRLTDIGGSCSIQSGVGDGTSVQIRLGFKRRGNPGEQGRADDARDRGSTYEEDRSCR
jgi:signal transduction histidine kinase